MPTLTSVIYLLITSPTEAGISANQIHTFRVVSTFMCTAFTLINVYNNNVKILVQIMLELCAGYRRSNY